MKKPMIRPRAGQMWTEGADWIVTPPCAYKNQSFRVRVSDAREITPEQAVGVVLNSLYTANKHYEWQLIVELAKKAGFTATFRNGKVTVRKAK